MQTLSDLHYNAQLAHLDISPESVLLQPSTQLPWDNLRLLNFANVRRCSTGDTAGAVLNLLSTNVYLV